MFGNSTSIFLLEYSKSPTDEQVPFLERVHKSSKASLGAQLTIGYLVQNCNRFVIFSPRYYILIENKQKIKKMFLILQYSTLKSTVVQYNSIQGLALSEQQKELLAGGRRGGGRW